MARQCGIAHVRADILLRDDSFLGPVLSECGDLYGCEASLHERPGCYPHPLQHQVVLSLIPHAVSQDQYAFGAAVVAQRLGSLEEDSPCLRGGEESIGVRGDFHPVLDRLRIRVLRSGAHQDELLGRDVGEAKQVVGLIKEGLTRDEHPHHRDAVHPLSTESFQGGCKGDGIGHAEGDFRGHLVGHGRDRLLYHPVPVVIATVSHHEEPDLIVRSGRGRNRSVG